MTAGPTGFSRGWEEAYRAERHMSVWPWSDLVGFVMRYAKPNGKDFKVLETGCGAGANIPFFESLGVDYYGVEGSETIVGKVKDRFPRYADNIVCTDFTRNIPFDIQFDLVIDRASIKHNHIQDIRNTMHVLYNSLKTNAIFIGIDWSSTRHSAFRQGRPLPDDPYGRADIESGSYEGIGIVHFFDKDHLIETLKPFTIEALQHKEYFQEIPESDTALAFWNFVARK